MGYGWRDSDKITIAGKTYYLKQHKILGCLINLVLFILLVILLIIAIKAFINNWNEMVSSFSRTAV